MNRFSVKLGGRPPESVGVCSRFLPIGVFFLALLLHARSGGMSCFSSLTVLSTLRRLWMRSSTLQIRIDPFLSVSLQTVLAFHCFFFHIYISKF